MSPNGSGTTYTEAIPGNLTTLLGSPVACGTTIMLMDGVYTDNGLSLVLTGDCSPEEPIVFMAAPGTAPIIDGGYHQPLQWIQNVDNPKLYSATLPEAASYTNLCLLNGKMLYPYPSFYSNLLVDTFSLAGLGFQYDGFVRDDQFIYIHTAEGTDPNVGEVVLSQAFRFLTVHGNNYKAYLRFEGITVKNFAKSNVPLFSLGYAAIAFDFRNVHQVVFSNCNFAYNNFHLSFGGTCDDLLIQLSLIHIYTTIGIIGAGGLGKEVLCVLGELIGWENLNKRVGFLVEPAFHNMENVLGVNVLLSLIHI